MSASSRYIDIKIVYKTKSEIVIFIAPWDLDSNLKITKTVEALFASLNKKYSKVVVFIIPWWYRSGIEHYNILKPYTSFICILANALGDNIFYKNCGYNSFFCNQNCWLDSNVFNIKKEEKIFDLVINANNNKWKNHSLLTNLNKKFKTLFVTYDVRDDHDLLQYNPSLLKKEIHSGALSLALNQCKIGLVLSEEEGACYASTEYLLCGLPVISVKNRGGRDVWYNKFNSLTINKDEAELESAIQYIQNNSHLYNNLLIRKNCMDLLRIHRGRFFDFLQTLFSVENIKEEVLRHFSNRMLQYQSLDSMSTDDVLSNIETSYDKKLNNLS